MAPMAELCITEARGEEETWKRTSNTRNTQLQKLHMKNKNALKQKYTNKPGRNWSLLKWLLNLLPTWRTSETCLEKYKYKYKYTGMDQKQKYELDPPGMEDMLIAV